MVVKRKAKSKGATRTVRDTAFITMVQSIIDNDPGWSMRSIARELDVGESTVRRCVYEDLRYKSYAMRTEQLLTEKAKKKRESRGKKLLNKLKHPLEPDMLWFFSDEKNFCQDQAHNRRNNPYLYGCLTERDARGMHTKCYRSTNSSM